MPKLSVGKGKKRILIITSVSVAAILAVVLILYFTNKGFKRRIDALLKIGGGDLGPIVEKAGDVSFSMPEDRVPPDSEFTIVGEFTDNEGKPVRVKQGLYYIIKNASGDAGPRELLMQGSLGTNVGKFSKVISTSGFPRGNDYDVVVTDTPLTVADIQGEGEQKGPGLGEGGGIPLGIGKGDRESQVNRSSAKLGISGLT